MTEEERELWLERINSYKSSGLTAAQWCEHNDIPIHKLRYRIAYFNKENSQKSKKPQWVSVVTPKSDKEKIPDKTKSTPLKVTIGKSTIEVSSGFDPDTFKKVVGILSKC